MKTLHSIQLLLIALLISYSCSGKPSNNNTQNQVDSIPADAVKFTYDISKNSYDVEKRAIMFDGIINDTIPINVFFDTGWLNVYNIVIPDTLKNNIGKDSCTLRIKGRFGRKLQIAYRKKDSPWSKYFGQNTAAIGWDYFDDKIIEISYKHQYLRELKDTAGLEKNGFKRVQIYNLRGWKGVPVIIYVQGKKIVEVLMLDTGYNGCIDLNYDIASKYHVNLDNIRHATSISTHTPFQKCFIESDSIIVGYSLAKKLPIGFLTSNKMEMPGSGLIGNQFFENFTVVFDFKNFNLYLRPTVNS